MFSFFRRKQAESAPGPADAPASAPAPGSPPTDLPVDRPVDRTIDRPRTAREWLNADVGELLFGRKPAAESAPPATTTAPSAPIAAPAPPEPVDVAPAPAPVAPVKPPTAIVPPPRPAAAPTEPAPEAESAPAEDRRDWLSRLKNGLRRTGTSIADVLIGAELDEPTLEDLEAALLQADAGSAATTALLDDLQGRVRRADVRDPKALRRLLADAVADLLQPLERPLVIGEHVPTVIMVAGVNGAGKTTTIGKLSRHLLDADRRVLLAAADTFRAAAREQLLAWAERAGPAGAASAAGPADRASSRIEIVSQEGGDPAGVAFDAVKAGKARGADVVIVDTAGRLATQAHLMEELRKIRRTIAKAEPGAPHEVLLVIDGNTGQNALAQVVAFDAALDLTGLVVTKLDGTAKGGVLAAIALWSKQRAKPLPVYFIGVGETLADLQTFRAREFANALVGTAD